MEQKKKILDTAQALFGRYGLRKVTTDDIAKDARVSKATIYRLYTNKQDILIEVIQQEMNDLLTRIRKEVAAEKSVHDKLRAHLLTKIHTVHKLINLHNVTSHALSEHWEHAEELKAEFIQKEAAIVVEILVAGVNSGELQVINPEATAHFMVVSLQSLEYPWSLPAAGFSIEQQVDLMLDILLNGLRIRNN